MPRKQLKISERGKKKSKRHSLEVLIKNAATIGYKNTKEWKCVC